MKKVTSFSSVYVAPLCITLEVHSEEVLCSSLETQTEQLSEEQGSWE